MATQTKTTPAPAISNELPEETPDPETKPASLPIVHPNSEPKEEEDQEDYVYRLMGVDNNGKSILPPFAGPVYSKHLGARPQDMEGMRSSANPLVLNPGPYNGGMSVMDTPIVTNPVMQDKLNSGKLVMFKIKVRDLNKNGLSVVKDGVNHGSVQPTTTTTEDTYQSSIFGTRNDWEQAY